MNTSAPKSIAEALKDGDLETIEKSAGHFLGALSSSLEHEFILAVNSTEDFGGYPAQYLDFYPVGNDFAPDHKKFGGIFVRVWAFGNPMQVVTGIFMGAERAEQSEPRRGVNFLRGLLEPKLSRFEENCGFEYHIWGSSNFEWTKKSSRALARQLEQFVSFREDRLDENPEIIQKSVSEALKFLDANLSSLVPVDTWAKEVISLYYGENIPSPTPLERSEIFENSVMEGLFFNPYCTLASKRFLIFTGLSGSGKSCAAKKIAKLFSTDPLRYHFAAVGPDWSNRDPLLGYPDGIQPEVYQSTPVLELLIRARAPGNDSQPYFLILDEMNLSHVERYFADFLSAMESGEQLSLYVGDERGEIPKTISIPPNFFIIGTVNIDETTYQFSPKVLDRANVIEFRMEKGAVSKFFDGSTDEMEAGALAGIAEQFVNDAKTEDKDAVEWAAGREGFREEMEALFNVLQNFNAEFGYRTLKESSRYLYFHDKYPGKNPDGTDKSEEEKYTEAMDHIIIQKLLPKLHGSRSKLEGVLRALLHFCEAGDRDMTALQASSLKAAEATDTALDMLGKRDGVEIEGHYKLSHDKLRRMCRKLHQDQFVSFADA